MDNITRPLICLAIIMATSLSALCLAPVKKSAPTNPSKNGTFSFTLSTGDGILFLSRGGDRDPCEVTYKQGYLYFQNHLERALESSVQTRYKQPPDSFEPISRTRDRKIGVLDVCYHDSVYEIAYQNRHLESQDQDQDRSWPTIGQLVLAGEEDGSYQVYFVLDARYGEDNDLAGAEGWWWNSIGHAANAIVNIVSRELDRDRERIYWRQRLREHAVKALQKADREFQKADREFLRVDSPHARKRGYALPSQPMEEAVLAVLKLLFIK